MKRHRTKPDGQVRIIGGRWRRRRLPVAHLPGLRPTPDRVRETLFNWLAPVIHGARCLDLFAGSGALGLEAASRGAARVVLVERERHLCDLLEQHRRSLQAQAVVEIACAEAIAWVRAAHEDFDVVFVDPPFDSGLAGPACVALDTAHCLRAGALVYVEQAAEPGVPDLPAAWTIRREAHAGRVRYLLAEPGAACPTSAATQ